LLPEPSVAGNNPVSSSRNPLDSAINLNLHSNTQNKKNHRDLLAMHDTEMTTQDKQDTEQGPSNRQ